MRRLLPILFLIPWLLGAITITNRTALFDTAAASSYNTASVSIAAGSVVLVGVTSSIASGTAPTISVSGLTLTWAESAMTLYSATVRRIAVWEAFAASAQSGVITITHDVNSTGTSWSVEEVTGMDTTDPVLQPTTGTTGTTSITITLAAAGDAANRPYLFNSHRANEVTAHDSAGGWTELSDVNGTGPSMGAEAQYKSDAFDTTCFASWTTSSNTGGVCLEIKIAAGAPPAAPPPHRAIWLVAGVDACQGAAEQFIASVVEWGSKLFEAWVACPTETNPEATCPVYSDPLFQEHTRIFGAGEKSYDMPPDPPDGSVAFLRVTTVDGDGNLDTEACQ